MDQISEATFPQYYARLFRAKDFWRAVSNSLLLVVVPIAVQLGVGMILALINNIPAQLGMKSPPAWLSYANAVAGMMFIISMITAFISLRVTRSRGT